MVVFIFIEKWTGGLKNSRRNTFLSTAYILTVQFDVKIYI